jgi:hypothetical protein
VAVAKPSLKPKSSPKLESGSGPYEAPLLDPEDLELNDRRKLQWLQKMLAARHYEKFERPAILAKIAELEALLADALEPAVKKEAGVQ